MGANIASASAVKVTTTAIERDLTDALGRLVPVIAIETFPPPGRIIIVVLVVVVVGIISSGRGRMRGRVGILGRRGHPPKNHCLRSLASSKTLKKRRRFTSKPELRFISFEKLVDCDYLYNVVQFSSSYIPTCYAMILHMKEEDINIAPSRKWKISTQCHHKIL